MRSFEPPFVQEGARISRIDFAVSALQLVSWQHGLPLPKKAFRYMDPNIPLRVTHMTDHFCFDCFNQIIAYIDESDLKHNIRIMPCHGAEYMKLT